MLLWIQLYTRTNKRLRICAVSLLRQDQVREKDRQDGQIDVIGSHLRVTLCILKI